MSLINSLLNVDFNRTYHVIRSVFGLAYTKSLSLENVLQSSTSSTSSTPSQSLSSSRHREAGTLMETLI